MIVVTQLVIIHSRVVVLLPMWWPQETARIVPSAVRGEEAVGRPVPVGARSWYRCRFACDARVYRETWAA